MSTGAQCAYSFHRCGGPPPSKREVWGVRRSRPTALPPIAYRGFAVAPITLRPLSKPLIQPRVQGRNPARFKGGYGVPRGFKGGSKPSAPCGRLSEAEHPKRKGATLLRLLSAVNSKSPPNPLGLAERVLRPQAVEGVRKQWRRSRSGDGGKGFRIVGSEKNGSNRIYGDFRFATDRQQAVCLLHDVCKLRIAIPLNSAIGFDIAKQAR